MEFELPLKALKPGHSEDGMEIWLEAGGKTAIFPFLMKIGLRISVPQEIQELLSFTIAVDRSTGETGVWSGVTYDSGADVEFPMAETDGSGNARIEVKMPRLIVNGADRDGAELWVRTRGTTWVFPFTLIAAPSAPSSSSSPANTSRIVDSSGRVVSPPAVPPPSTPRPQYSAPMFRSTPQQFQNEVNNLNLGAHLPNMLWVDWQDTARAHGLRGRVLNFVRGEFIDAILASTLKRLLEQRGYFCPTPPEWLILVPGSADTIWVGLTCARPIS
jgi:hypothetical protein